MIELQLPPPVLWLLRWVLLLGPLAAVLWLGLRNRDRSRLLVGALFSFLYGLGSIFVTHQIAFHFGWWTYGGGTLMVSGLPADIWLGGSLLFGPVLFLAFPTRSPFTILLTIVILVHGLFFLSLPPLVYPGEHWYAGVLFVFATAHLPALFLARWTAENRHLEWRVALLAVGYGCLAFAVLPSLIMVAMGGTWSLSERPPEVLALSALAIGACFVVGLTAVQLFAVHGEGTPIPLDPTRRLVRSGLFAYVRNPMQLSTAATWIVMGAALQNIFVALAAVMAWVFVAGMVRWHHRYDLELRFPQGWAEYTAHVPEWRPRWRPWIKAPSRLSYGAGEPRHIRFADHLARSQITGLDLVPVGDGALLYRDGYDGREFRGASAVFKALGHVDFVWAVVGAGGLLIVLPVAHVAGLWRTFIGRSQRAVR